MEIRPDHDAAHITRPPDPVDERIRAEACELLIEAKDDHGVRTRLPQEPNALLDIRQR